MYDYVRIITRDNKIFDYSALGIAVATRREVLRLEKVIRDIHNKFKLNFYKNIFNGFEDGENVLTLTERFTLEVIDSLDHPTITDLSNYLGISQPNTTYKANELIKKGYVIKKRDEFDKRRVRLYTTEKLGSYRAKRNLYVSTLIQKINEHFPEKELKSLEAMLTTIEKELMPEIQTRNE